MLVESDVVAAVEAYLARKGFRLLTKVPTTHSHGVDLAMVSPRGTRLCIEAKGQTSERRGTDNFGNEFSHSQKLDHFGMAIARTMKVVSARERWAIALPGDEYDRRLVEERKEGLRRLKVACFLVDDRTRAVTIPVGELPP